MLPGSFVISLAIAIAITKSPASGFTIGRSHNVSDLTQDLETGESTQLEVRYDLKALHDLKHNVIDKANEKSDSTVIAINDPKNKDRNNVINENVITTSQPIANEIPDFETPISGVRNTEPSTDTLTVYSTVTVSSSYTSSATSTSQTTTREREKGEDHLTTFTVATSDTTETPNDYLSNVINQNTSQQENKENGNGSADTKMTLRQNTTGDVNSTEWLLPEHTTISKDTTTAPDSYVERKEIIRSIFDMTDNITNDTTYDDSPVAVNNTDLLITRKNTDDENTIIKSDEPNSILTTTHSEAETVVTTPVSNDASTTELDVTTEMYSTETVTTEYNAPVLPPWKKYITIDRKRNNTEKTMKKDKDMIKAETAQTRLSLENVLSNTPIPSLEQLKNDLINAQESTAKNAEATNVTEVNVSSAPELGTTTVTKMMTEAETDTTKLELVSKRAGYIDNTETTTPKPEEATTTEFPQKVSANNPEMFGTMYETEPGEIDVPENKNVTGLESQSQLAEDAIKEELLREETLHDNEENAKRHRDERLVMNTPKYVNDAKTTESYSTVHEVVTEDILSVKPIGQDKKKHAGLYAVSPNYKPLKKLDGQPPKQFVRDPDDNSWRNESISSLGIVFKPKNASKSFTQVLKNKTETELLGNMTERENKDDVPDLRIRLEKIAEVRKSKKKRINKFGDTVYSDYEESSGENINSIKDEYVTSPMSSSVETVQSTTPTSLQSQTTDSDLVVNGISKDNDLSKKDETTPLTTDKPKKFYNLAEYYDTTDEYDADYVNLSKIDLKKFTQPFKATETTITQPPELLRTKPMREYQPERKATVQYFPPTQKYTQKVNLNDYDTDFNRKVNLYTFKEPPQTVLSVSYGTVSPLQTEKYEPVNKITAKPAFTPIYRPDNFDKNLYLTNQPRVTEPPNGFVVNDGNFNRASYVIKHYRDFINEAAKESDDERNPDYLPYTQAPLQGVTINDLAKMTTVKDTNQGDEDYDYETKFRKDVLNRFVDNFNHNSERFKVDFPILYNNSIVHRRPIEGKVASSSAFMKRLYETSNPRPSNILSNTKACDPHCDNMTVELSPAYELHYYVPEQEEKEEIEPRPITLSQRFRL